MRKAILSLGLFVALGGCPGPQPANNMIAPTPLPSVTPTPAPYLTSDPVCTGTLTRGEWLICDNKSLNDLHRRLAQEWQAARQTASPEREQVLDDQLYALLSERDACQDAACVATAYRRYLSAPPSAAPAPAKWKPRPKPKPKPRWHPRPRHDRGDDRDWRDDPVKGQSCIGSAGPGPAHQLSRQCDAVNSGPGRLCSPRRSCGDLRDQITHGCRQSYRKPGFCRL